LKKYELARSRLLFIATVAVAKRQRRTVCHSQSVKSVISRNA